MYGHAAIPTSASGFSTNIGYSTNGGSDTAYFFDSPGNDTFYAYAGLQQQRQARGGHVRQLRRHGRIANAASGFATNAGYASNGGSDTAYFFDSPGNDTFYAYADYNRQRQAVGGHVRQLRRRVFQFGQRLRHRCRLFDHWRQRYGLFLRLAGQRHVLCLRGLPITAASRWRACTAATPASAAYSNSASGFATNIGYSTSGGNDTAYFYDSPGNDTFYAYGDYNSSGRPLAGMYGSYRLADIPTRPTASAPTSAFRPQRRQRYGHFFDSPGNATFYAYADYNSSGRSLAGMYGSYAGFGAYSNLAGGFGANLGYATSGGNDTADLFGSSGNSSSNALYTDAGDRLALRQRQQRQLFRGGFGVPGRQRVRPGRHEHPDQGAGPPGVSVEFARQLDGRQLRRIIHKL